MFNGCCKLNELDLSNFNTSNVTDMSYMFQRCTSLENLNISNFNMDKVKNTNGMFEEYPQYLIENAKRQIKFKENKSSSCLCY